MSDSKELSRDDLFLLMQSYKNTVESNTILLEQQKTLIDQHETLIHKQRDVLTLLGKVIDKFDTINDVKTSLSTQMSTNHLECTKERSSLKGKLIIIYAGIGTVIVSLISLVITVFNKMDLIEKIAKQLGVIK